MLRFARIGIGWTLGMTWASVVIAAPPPPVLPAPSSTVAPAATPPPDSSATPDLPPPNTPPSVPSNTASPAPSNNPPPAASNNPPPEPTGSAAPPRPYVPDFGGWGASGPYPGARPIPYDHYAPDLPYEDGQPIPPGYMLRERTRKGPFIAGGVTFGATYIGAVGIGLLGFAISQDTGWRWLFAPVIGPWVAVETTKRSRDTDADLFPIVFVGVGQAIGLGLFIGSFFFPKEKKLIWAPGAPGAAPGPKLSLAPWATSKSGGIAVGGSW